MREMGNWNEYFIGYLAADHEAAIDYLQLTLEEYLADGDLPFFLKGIRDFCRITRWGFRTFQTNGY